MMSEYGRGAGYGLFTYWAVAEPAVSTNSKTPGRNRLVVMRPSPGRAQLSYSREPIESCSRGHRSPIVMMDFNDLFGCAENDEYLLGRSASEGSPCLRCGLTKTLWANENLAG